MALRDKLRRYKDAPTDTMDVAVDVAPDILEFKISRRDLSPAFERDLLSYQLQANAEAGFKDESFTVVDVEVVAKRIRGTIISYRIYPKDMTEAKVAKEAWLSDLTDKDLLGLGYDVFWQIVGAITGRLNPNVPSGENG